MSLQRINRFKMAGQIFTRPKPWGFLGPPTVRPPYGKPYPDGGPGYYSSTPPGPGGSGSPCMGGPGSAGCGGTYSGGKPTLTGYSPYIGPPIVVGPNDDQIGRSYQGRPPGYLGPPVRQPYPPPRGGQLGSVAAPYDSPCPQDDGTQNDTHVVYVDGNPRCVNNQDPILGGCPDGNLFMGYEPVLDANRHIIGRYPICRPVAGLGPCPVGQLRNSHGQCVCPPGQTQGDGRTTDPTVCTSVATGQPAHAGGLLDGSIDIFGHQVPTTYLLAGAAVIGGLVIFGGKR